MKREHGAAKTNESQNSLLDEKYVDDRHQCHLATKFGVCIDEDHSMLSTLNGLPKLHRSYKSRFIPISSPCITTEMSMILTSCLTVIKNNVIIKTETFLRGMV